MHDMFCLNYVHLEPSQKERFYKIQVEENTIVDLK